MKVVILAAGAGMRLGEHDLPKPLTELQNGQSILGRQIELLSRYLVVDDIIVVVGYHKEKIMKAFPNLLYVYNPNYASENTSKSLLRALNKINESVLWLNGDVVFHPQVLESILYFGDKNSMVVNKAPVGDEEVKYRSDIQGKILEISKNVSQPQGEALGINFITKKDLPLFKSCLSQCALLDYFEKGLEMCIEKGITIWEVPVEKQHCLEIDFPEDLENAKRILSSWK